ncbi:MAG: PHP domain-containing protein, partial [Gemmatimonadales bacterium]
MHSTASDGECTPADVAARARSANLDSIALTDHDTVAGVAAARFAGAALGLDVVAGCEFSVKARWGELHLLSYFLPLDSERLEEFLSGQREARRARAVEMVRRLEVAGAPISFEAVDEVAGSASIGRPHVARVLVDAGHATSRQGAFDRWIGYRRPGFVAKKLPAVAAVARLVTELGGVSVAAHLGSRGTRVVVQELSAAGVDGIEVLHPSHDDATAQELDRLADRFDMLRSGGSDWHGPSAEIDRATLGDMDVPAVWLDRIRE